MAPKPQNSTETVLAGAKAEDETPAKEFLEDSKAEYIHNNDTDTQICAYDKVLPKGDPAFMAPIRRWEKRVGFVTPIRWINTIAITLFHIISVLGMFYVIFFEHHRFTWKTFLFGVFMGIVVGFGVTGGAHRLWTHKSYKAKLPLKLFLLFAYSAAGQNSLFDWVRDHRVHHKHSETSGDPHDANRGFFFSHVGWLMMKKHPDVLKAGAETDMSDIVNDPLLKFHTKYFIVFKLLSCFIIPTMIPVYCWGESWDLAIVSQALVRYMLSLNFTWSVNSFAHLWGHKPYDVNIMPTENWYVSVVAMGEGWHNYHHTFPWDYKAAEIPYTLNNTTILLDLFAKIGWVYDRKKASQSLISSVIKNRGPESLHQKDL